MLQTLSIVCFRAISYNHENICRLHGQDTQIAIRHRRIILYSCSSKVFLATS